MREDIIVFLLGILVGMLIILTILDYKAKQGQIRVWGTSYKTELISKGEEIIKLNSQQALDGEGNYLKLNKDDYYFERGEWSAL